MKRVYDCEQFISLTPSHNFQETSIYYHLHLLSAEESLNRTHRIYYKTFEEFFSAVENGVVRNADAYFGMFKQPKIKVRCGIDYYTITKHNFKEVCVWNHAKDVSHLPMSTLIKQMPADEFAEYLRERGIPLKG